MSNNRYTNKINTEYQIPVESPKHNFMSQKQKSHARRYYLENQNNKEFDFEYIDPSKSCWSFISGYSNYYNYLKEYTVKLF